MQGLVPALALANFAAGVGLFAAAGVLAPISRAFGISVTHAGWIVTVYAVVYAVASPLLIAWTRRVDRAVVLTVGLGILCLGSAAAAAAVGFGMLLAARAAMALGSVLVTPVAASIALLGTSPAGRGRSLAMVYAGFTAAQAIGVPAAPWLGYAAGWRWTFVAGSGIAFVSAAVAWASLPRGIARPTAAPAGRAGLAVDAALVFAMGFTVLFTAATAAVQSYLPVILEKAYGLESHGIAAVLLVYGAVAMVGNAIGGLMTDRFGPHRTLLCLSSMLAIVLVLTTTVTGSLALTVAFTCLLSLCGWGFGVPQQSRLASRQPVHLPMLFGLHASSMYGRHGGRGVHRRERACRPGHAGDGCGRGRAGRPGGRHPAAQGAADGLHRLPWTEGPAMTCNRVSGSMKAPDHAG